MNPNWFVQRLLKWHALHGRHHLPWKKPRSAYRVWLSEIMLQQTQVTTVIPYFQRFIKAFPSVKKLAQAPLDEVLRHWSGLGYYARARHLHQTAQILLEHYQGRFPHQLDLLLNLPGIGRSTAGAILAQAFDMRAPILDGNVKRVLCRFHCLEGWPQERVTQQKLWQLAELYTPSKQVADYTQAIMDLGATCCTRQPNCSICPLQKRCLAFIRQQQKDYPKPKPKKVLPHRHLLMLLILNNKGNILLQRRALKGIWAGLWSLPEFTSVLSLKQFLQTTFQLSAFELKSLPHVKHTFTHFHLQIKPQLLQLTQAADHLDPNFAWVDGVQNKGLPAPIKKIIQTLLSNN